MTDILWYLLGYGKLPCGCWTWLPDFSPIPICKHTQHIKPSDNKKDDDDWFYQAWQPPIL